MFRNYYEILEVRETASLEVIKVAYKELAKKYHPDRSKDCLEVANENMKLLNTAYEILSNPIQREIYDRELNINNNNQSQWRHMEDEEHLSQQAYYKMKEAERQQEEFLRKQEAERQIEIFLRRQEVERQREEYFRRQEIERQRSEQIKRREYEMQHEEAKRRHKAEWSRAFTEEADKLLLQIRIPHRVERSHIDKKTVIYFELDTDLVGFYTMYANRVAKILGYEDFDDFISNDFEMKKIDTSHDSTVLQKIEAVKGVYGYREFYNFYNTALDLYGDISEPVPDEYKIFYVYLCTSINLLKANKQ